MQFTAGEFEFSQVKCPHGAVNLQPEVEDQVGQRLTQLDVVDDVGDEARADSPGLYPDPPDDHLDVGVHQGPPTHLDWRVTRELGQTPPEYLVTKLKKNFNFKSDF